MSFDFFEDSGVKVRPLAFESLGVRGMATYIETEDMSMIADPGSALGPRFNLPPHIKEYTALYKSREDILSASKNVDLLSISHYHFDHFIPNFENWKYIWSSPEMAKELYSGKLILGKDISENINPSQRKRGYMFRKKNLDYAEEIRVADNHELSFDSTNIRFSQPVPHGSKGSDLGYSLILTLETPNFSLVHAPDVQGPMYSETLDYLLEQNPDLLIIGGPPIYISFKLEDRDLEYSKENLIKLAENIPKLVIDHHLLRSLDYRDFLKPIYEAADKHGNEVLTAAELIGKDPDLLEARRKELHEEEPVEDEWYESLEDGKFEEGFTNSE